MSNERLATANIEKPTGRNTIVNKEVHYPNTVSTMWAATSTMRRALHDGQTPRALQE